MMILMMMVVVVVMMISHCISQLTPVIVNNNSFSATVSMHNCDRLCI